MKATTKGLVLREVKTGEADRILSILTPSGIISASAKGSLRPKNRLFSATGLFCYSEFTLYEGRTMFRIDEAASLEVFFGLRQSIEGISLATYLCEILQVLQPTGEEASKLLRLTLNSFYLLAENKKTPWQVKAVYELRSLSESGFMPNLLACRSCAKYEDALFYFDARRGTLLCPDCARDRDIHPNIDGATLAALRHIVLSEDEKVYSFTLKEESMRLLNQAAERFVLYNLDYPPKSLEFLKTVLIP